MNKNESFEKRWNVLVNHMHKNFTEHEWAVIAERILSELAEDCNKPLADMAVLQYMNRYHRKGKKL